jgi:hypothetical protein
MPERCLKILTLACALLFGQSAPSAQATEASSNERSAGFHQWQTDAVQALAARGDADSLATAAAIRFHNWRSQPRPNGIMPPSPSPSALQLAAQANELAAQDPAIIWLHLQLCAETTACNSREVAIVLRWVDPDNSVAWMSELADAQKEKDSTEIDRVLGDMARGTRFDLYRNPLVMRMFDALSGIRRELRSSFDGSELAKLITVEGIADAEITPPLVPLSEACHEAAANSERREDCLKLAKIMQRGDTVLIQLAGFSMEKRLIPADSREAKALAERRHLLEWRCATAYQLNYAILPWTQKARTRALIALMRGAAREEDVCIGLLKEHKMALEPAESHQ